MPANEQVAAKKPVGRIATKKGTGKKKAVKKRSTKR